MLAPVFSSFQRCFAVFSLLLFLQAVSPSAVFSTDTGVTKSQNANPLAEEEDENSDINLKFFCEHCPGLLEVSSGHALISDALYYGLANTIRMYLRQL